ncbi:E3 ubiquitin-protein ligase TRIM21-like [Phascolarctos cinereus]
MEVLQDLQREITCSICWSYFSEPVALGCGHSFGRACLSWSWRLGAATSSCPECGQVSQTVIRREYNNLHHFLMEEQFQYVERVKQDQGANLNRVDVSQLPEWVLGIYTPYLRRKRDRNVNSSDSVLLLHCDKKEEGHYLQTCSGSLKHGIKGRVPRVGVYLEYVSGTLGFYNLLQRSHIYRFHSIPFTGTVTPFFSPGLPLPGTKAGPTTLCPVDSHLCACCYSEHLSRRNLNPPLGSLAVVLQFPAIPARG